MKSSGQFENWANQIRWKNSGEDKREMKLLTDLIHSELGGQIHWAGSQRKGTAIEGSDLDMCIETQTPVSASIRRKLARSITDTLKREAKPHSHVIRVKPRKGGSAKLDIAFANADFGSRPLPNVDEFRSQNRQHATRALKWWLRSDGMPSGVKGWAIEGLVVQLDNNEATGYELFEKIIRWLARPCTFNDVESILRPRAEPEWRPEWSKRLPGQIQAISSQARRLVRSLPENFSSPDDIERWLRPF